MNKRHIDWDNVLFGHSPNKKLVELYGQICQDLSIVVDQQTAQNVLDGIVFSELKDATAFFEGRLLSESSARYVAPIDMGPTLLRNGASHANHPERRLLLAYLTLLGTAIPGYIVDAGFGNIAMKKPQFLVVEPDPHMQIMYQGALQTQHPGIHKPEYDAIILNSTEKAHHSIFKNADLLLLNVKLAPHDWFNDAFSFARYVKSSYDLPIIATVPKCAEIESSYNPMEIDAVFYVREQFSPITLLKTVRDTLAIKGLLL